MSKTIILNKVQYTVSEVHQDTIAIFELNGQVAGNRCYIHYEDHNGFSERPPEDKCT